MASFQDLHPLQCPACLRFFGTQQGINSHLSTTKSCKWYRKGNIRDLSDNIVPEVEWDKALTGLGEERADMPFQSYGIDMGSLSEAQDQDLFDNLASQQMDEYQLIPENVLQTLQHPQASGSQPLPQTQHCSLDDEDDTRFTAEHPTTGAVLPATPDGDGDIEMGDTTENNLNTFSPFSSELDWRIAEWAIKEKVGNSAIDRLLEIPGVCVPLALTSL